MKESLQPDFTIGNDSKDLMLYTLKICKNSDDSKKSRFPKTLTRYVDLLIETSIYIHRSICLANAERDTSIRKKYIAEAKGYCVHLSHLIDIAYNGKWISEKQHDTWLGINNKVYWKIIHWK